MYIRLLGPVEARDSGRPLALGATKQRAVLAMLALQANRAVSTDRLSEGLWGEHPPASAPKMVQVYVSQLRKLLAGTEAEIVTRGRGYELRAPREAVDAVLFERLAVADGRAALELWAGPPLADVADEPFAAAEIRRLEELRLHAFEHAIDAELDAGRHRELLAELDALVAEHPLSERLHARRMLALYRSGRQAEALGAFRHARELLVEQVGVEPGAELRALHEAILNQDPELLPAAAPGPSAREPGAPATFVTILFTDLVGSTSLFEARGDEEADALRRGHFAALRRAVAEHGGREVKSTGDGLMVAFGSAVAGVRCAVAMQRTTEAAQDGLGLRVGLDAGEPIAEGDDLYGRPVIVASRLCNAAEGGQILATEVVRQIAGPRVAALMRSARTRRLRGIEEPVAVAEVRWREARPAPQPRPAAPRRRAAIAAGLVAAAVLIALGVVLLSGDDEGLPAIADNSVGVIDTGEGRITAQYGVGHGATSAVAGGGSVWVANARDGTVTRIDPKTDRITTIDVGGEPQAVAYGERSLWVADARSGSVVQVLPDTNRVGNRFSVGNGPRSLAVGFGSVWAAASLDGVLAQIPLGGTSIRKTPLATSPTAVAAGEQAVWVASESAGTVAHVDPRSGAALASIHVGRGPTALAAGAGAVWVANRYDSTVSRIDPASDAVTETVRVGRLPAGVAVAGGAVWVANAGDDSVSRIDPRSRRVTKTIAIGASPAALTGAGDALYAPAVAPLERHRGGTLKLVVDPASTQQCGCADPVLYDITAFQIAGLAFDGLVAYRRIGGAGGATLVADLAEDLPEPASDGRTYVFRLRRGMRFSDGAPVRPSDFRASMERMLRFDAGKIPPLYQRILGADRCTPTRCDLRRGIETDDAGRTVTIRLTAPDPELLHKLTLPLASVLPARTPPAPAGLIAGTGPYRLARIDRTGARLERNPHFDSWSPDARPPAFADSVALTFDPDDEARLEAARTGKSDVALVGGPTLPGGTVERLVARYGGRVYAGPQPLTVWLSLNVRERPFDDVRVRRALNYAIDRAKFIALTVGAQGARATCQVLPPGLPGYEAHCPYTARPDKAGAWTGPDLAKARALVEASGTKGMRVKVWLVGERRAAVARYIRSVLRALGYRGSTRVTHDIEVHFTLVGDARRHVQAAEYGFVADYLSAAGFIPAALSCASIVPEDSSNVGRFCDPALDRAMERASRARGAEAAALWAGIDRRITAAAPAVPLSNPQTVTLVSPRVGNFQQHPLWGPLLDQLWVQ